ncbi:competence protein CoiA family protein [Flavobacterium sp. 5]|uniref:competence protein CoiA family protein n=1 Tax=Flavobacterium sp. 5 TaxID=2035199 RepID=UPI000C2C1F78|nr:competence protein CoiA family protein [Flavobacterium sp. 5]PKB15323.1 competence protein CoiA-like protein [Flavobacterium sp. 5]
MKNLYAYNEENELIHINNVEKKSAQNYFCINCESKMIARKGEIKAHHFSHKADSNCSFESYLHKLSKIQFYNEYIKCLNNNESFNIQYKTYRNCTSCKEKENLNLVCKLDDKISLLNLTKWFDKITIEKYHNGFIADILLESSKSEEKLFIEFAVSHKCEIAKIESKIRIVEISLINELDLKFISERKIPINQENIIFHNFIINQKNEDYFLPNECNKMFSFFAIYQNNKAISKELRIKEIIYNLNIHNYKHFQILKPKEIDYEYDDEIESYSGGQFIDLIIKSAFEIKDFKNCYSCRFSAENNNYFSRYEFGHTLFCKKFKAVITNSNDGHNCEKYWRIEKPNIE